MAQDEDDDAVYVERLPARSFALLSGGIGSGLALVGAAYAVLGAIGDASAFIAAAVFGVAGVATGAFGLLHAVQRNRVTLDAFQVELGLGGVTIPLDAIDEVTLVDDTAELRRRIYAERAKKIALVASPQLVRIEWREDDAPRVFYTASRYPEQLRDAIRAAAAHRKKAPKVRVAAEAEAAEQEVARPKSQARRERKR
jgi:hypothetical protein